MNSTMALTLLSLAIIGQPTGTIDASALVDVLESLQTDVKDFRCSFEGTSYFKSEDVKRQRKLKEDGLYNTFSGIFIWTRTGDTFVNTLHRYEPEGRIMREQIVIRSKKKEAERYLRNNDSPIGRGAIEDPSRVNANVAQCFGQIFLIDQIKRMIGTKGIEACVSEEMIEGQRLTVLSFSFQGLNQVYQRYWIDLQRGGHVVRYEDYAKGNVLVGRIEIKLASFRIDKRDVWMPVSGVCQGYAALDHGDKPAASKEPTSVEFIYAVAGTMEFNKHPGPETFKISYRPGGPITDNLRKLEYEFGQQKVPARLTQAETKRMLEEQIIKAEEQKAELVVSTSSPGIPWSTWFAIGFGLLVVISSVALWMQRWR